MAKRHRMVAGDWESMFGRLQELVLAGSGEDDFQEIWRLVLAKLLAETRGDVTFAPGVTPAGTAEAISALLADAAERWPGILAGPPRSSLGDEHLHVCVEALSAHRILGTSLEVMDGAFEFLMTRTSKGAKGQFFTPRHVVDACVRIVKPRAGERIADPACGSAGFLMQAFRHVGDPGAPDLWGFDFDQRAVDVGRALMLIAGDGRSNVLRANSLATGPIEEALGGNAEFDAILTNPPFAGEVREPELLAGYELARGGGRVERDVLFLERCVRLLRPGGRLAIVLPHNKVAAGPWSPAREWLLRHVRVVAVLGLGRHTFQPHTGQKASVLFAERRPEPLPAPPDEEILFLVSEREGKDARGRVVERAGAREGQSLWERADHDLDACVEAFDAFAAERGLSGWTAS
jgi:type I restriction enzyme M protein